MADPVAIGIVERQAIQHELNNIIDEANSWTRYIETLERNCTTTVINNFKGDFAKGARVISDIQSGLISILRETQTEILTLCSDTTTYVEQHASNDR